MTKKGSVYGKKGSIEINSRSILNICVSPKFENAIIWLFLSTHSHTLYKEIFFDFFFLFVGWWGGRG